MLIGREFGKLSEDFFILHLIFFGIEIKISNLKKIHVELSPLVKLKNMQKVV